MRRSPFPLEIFEKLETPFYYYDTELLRKTLAEVRRITEQYGFVQHYAIKANYNKELLRMISAAGFGADCVNANEIIMAITNGFPASKIVFAGVGKTDKEIRLALELGIFCFNVESLPELEVINEIAGKSGIRARVALRINPDIDANTHEYITTGLNEDKFGLHADAADHIIRNAALFGNVEFVGLHFHIGSQVTDVTTFGPLCEYINEMLARYAAEGITFDNIDVGGGLGVDYENPDANPIADFQAYFDFFHNNLRYREGQVIHFELGRAIVAQCGSLISRVLYVKEGAEKNFVILDAGMTDLIRPALYQASHRIDNLSSEQPLHTYDIVGPVCESADTFAKNYELNATRRGDIVAIRSAGAYGEVMASRYNCRELPKSHTSHELQDIRPSCKTKEAHEGRVSL